LGYKYKVGRNNVIRIIREINEFLDSEEGQNTKNEIIAKYNITKYPTVDEINLKNLIYDSNDNN